MPDQPSRGLSSRHYDRAGEPIELEVWAERFGDEDYKRVARDEIGDVLISTVWLGLDHNWGDGPPLIFESMVFGGDLDQEQIRYSTESAALAGHADLVERVKASAGAR
jgi:hypothetical protein